MSRGYSVRVVACVQVRPQSRFILFNFFPTGSFWQRFVRLLLVMPLIGIAGLESTVAVAENDIIAQEGDLSPDGDGLFTSFTGDPLGLGFNYLLAPDLNNAGEVAFSGNATGVAGVDAIFRGTRDSVIRVSQAVGSNAPDGNGIYNGASYFPAINALGQLVFFSDYSGTLASPHDVTGINLGSGGAVTQVVRSSAAMPLLGGLIIPPRVNDVGAVAYATFTPLGPGPGSQIDRYFVDAGSGAVQIVEVGQAIVGGANTIDGLGIADFDNTNQVVFEATFSDKSVPEEDRIPMRGLFIGSGGALTTIALSGQPAPGTSNTFGGFARLDRNEFNQTVFVSGEDVPGSPSSAPPSSGLYLATGTSITKLSHSGDAAPRQTGGTDGSINSFFFPNLNDSGEVATVAFIDGASNPAADHGVYFHDGASLIEIERQGDATPDMNGTYGSFVQNDFGEFLPPVGLTNGGQVIFQSQLVGTANGVADDYGIFIADARETIVGVRKGQVLDGSTIIDFAAQQQTSPIFEAFDRDTGYNDHGQIAYTAELADGRELVGLFTPDLHWRDAVNDSWDVIDHWTVGLNPDAPHRVFIDPDNAQTVTGPAAATNIRSLTIGTQGAGTATLELDLTENDITIEEYLEVGKDGDGTLDHVAKVITVGGDVRVGVGTGDTGLYELGRYGELRVAGDVHVGRTDLASADPKGRFEVTDNLGTVTGTTTDARLYVHGSNARLIGEGVFDIKVTYESDPDYGAGSDQSVDISFDRNSLTRGAAHIIKKDLTDGETGSMEKSTALQMKLLANSSFDVNWGDDSDLGDIAYRTSTTFTPTKPEVAVPYDVLEIAGNSNVSVQNIEQRLRLWHFRDGKVSNLTDVNVDSTPRVDTVDGVVFGRVQDETQLLDEFNVAVGGVAVDPVHQDTNIQALHDLGLSGAGVLIGQIEDFAPFKEHGAFNDWDAASAAALRLTVIDTNPNSDPSPIGSRATAVASILVGYDPLGLQVDGEQNFTDETLRYNGGFGFVGVAPEATLTSTAANPTNFFEMFAALRGLVDDNNVKIINHSAGSQDPATPTAGDLGIELGIDYYVADLHEATFEIDGRDAQVVRGNGVIFIQQAGDAGAEAVTIGQPVGAYNTIVVGNAQMGGMNGAFPEQFDAANAVVRTGSSHGPLADGRVGVDLLAQGTANLAAFQRGDIESDAGEAVAEGRRGLYSTEFDADNVQDGTGFAAPTVAGVAALLVEKARSMNSETGESPLVIKSILQTSADKLAGWRKGDPGAADDAMVPLDYEQGAGLMDPLGAYNLLLAGEQEDGVIPVDPAGWDWDVIFEDDVSSFTTAGSINLAGHVYFLENITGGTLTATLNWFRRTENPGSGFIDEGLSNLDLFLYEWDAFAGIATQISGSISQIDNLEHIYLEGLLAGDYLLQVSGTSLLDIGLVDYEEYALSWEVKTVPTPGAVWLFGSGLFLLFGITRRRNKPAGALH